MILAILKGMCHMVKPQNLIKQRTVWRNQSINQKQQKSHIFCNRRIFV